MIDLIANIMVALIVGAVFCVPVFVILTCGLAIIAAIASVALPIAVIGGGMFLIFGVLGIGR
jgi:hypothetical protein